MNRLLVLSAGLLSFMLVSQDLLSQHTGRFGPAEDPERYPDYGGTPDATLSSDLGLSPDEIKGRLRLLVDPVYEVRLKAASELTRYASGSEQSFKEVLWDSHGARNAQIRQSMNIARNTLLNGNDKSGGLLGVLLKMNPENEETGQGTKAAVRVMSMLVALEHLNSMAGYKVMLDFSPRHAGVFRQEVGNMFVAKGLETLPALVYGRGSKNDELHMFAVKWIRDMGNPLLSEQIKGIKNPRRLAQLLEAYASVNELDAIDVTLSLTNHESVFVRNSARKCMVFYGKNAKWQIRRMFENTFGKEPGEDTDFGSWLRALYRHFDKERNAGALDVFQEGCKARDAGDFDLMAEKFKLVLRNTPMFPRRREMASGFILQAEFLEEQEKLSLAKDATRMALRVAEPGSAEELSARSRLDWMVAEENRKGGALDAQLYKTIAEKAPEIEGAVEMANELKSLEQGDSDYVKKAVLVSLFLFFSALLTYLRVRKRSV